MGVSRRRMFKTTGLNEALRESYKQKEEGTQNKRWGLQHLLESKRREASKETKEEGQRGPGATGRWSYKSQRGMEKEKGWRRLLRARGLAHGQWIQ